MKTNEKISSLYKELKNVLCEIDDIDELDDKDKLNNLNKLAEDLRNNIQFLALSTPIDQELLSKKILFNAVVNAVLFHILEHPELEVLELELKSKLVGNTVLNLDEIEFENELRKRDLNPELYSKYQEFLKIRTEPNYKTPSGRKQELAKDLKWIQEPQARLSIESYGIDTKRFKNIIKNHKNEKLDTLIEKYKKLEKL